MQYAVLMGLSGKSCIILAKSVSRIADQLYFAPNVRFADLDWTGVRLPTQFHQRMSGFYLKPAIVLAEAEHAFASGVLVVCAIDALALFTTGSSAVRARI